MRSKLDGTSRRLNMMTTEELMQRVDDWRRLEPDMPGVSEAVRRLIEHGLDNPAANRRTRHKAKAA
jgi:hypothetical protein